MSNFVFYDFETSSSNKYWGQIIQIGAVLTNDNLDELDRFDVRCRLSPGIIPEAMASSLIPIAFNYAAPKALIENNVNGYLADYNDSDSFLKTIDHALDKKNEWSKIRKNARQTAENLNWKNIVKGFAGELNQAYQEHRTYESDR